MFRKVKKRHSSSSSQSSEISTKSKSVDSSVGGLSRSSTVASLDTDSNKSSGNAASDTCAEFRVKYVGSIKNLQFEMSRTLQEPLDLISYIDAAQQDGKLPFVPGDEEMVLGVSKYGVKVASVDQCVSWLTLSNVHSAGRRLYSGMSCLLWTGRAAPAPSLLDSAHAVLRRRPGSREEPAGPENHRHAAGGVQHLGVPVQQLGASSVHLQGAVRLLRLRPVVQQTLKPRLQTLRRLGVRLPAPHQSPTADQNISCLCLSVFLHILTNQWSAVPAASSRGRSYSFYFILF
uniref:Integrin beta-1-binding protein 1 n=1 Tax=Fundulus heteroclitus TaxID=8078 RepID=A0A146WGX3_FUNHE